MSSNYVTKDTLRGTGYALMAVTTLITAVRLSSVLMHPKTFQWDDGFLIGAYVFFLVVAILYQVVANAMFKLQAVEEGKIPQYETIADDGLFVQKVFFVATSSLWFNLWCVKYSLLAFYKRLIVGLKTYTIIWTVIVVFCFVVLVGAVTSSMLSCSSMKAWFTAGACSTPRDIKAASISLWYAFAVDVLTDLLVMFLPVGLIWKLQMPLVQKASIGGLFCLGWICIIVAIVRVKELGGTTDSNTAPSPAWLGFWGTVETAIAVVIGCCPGLYRRFRPHTPSTKASYNSYGYGFPRSGTGGNTLGSQAGATDLELQPGRSNPSRIRKTTDINISTHVYGDATSSQEELTAEHQSYRDPGRPADIYSFEMK